MKTFHSLLLATLFVPVIAAQAEPEEGWVELFNGKNLDGWTQRNGLATYRVEGTSDLATGTWSSVWEGSAADVDADGGVSMPMSLEGGDRYFRVMVLVTE